MTVRRPTCVALLIVAATATVTAAAPPDFGPGVTVLDPSMLAADVQRRVDAVFARQERDQFGTDRDAVLFKPGKYAVDVRVGFYTQVAGLGGSPDDVDLTGSVRADAKWLNGNATCNFWRSAENLSVRPRGGPDVWAVSQGADLRRLHVRGDVNLWDGGWSSGGFLADSLVDGNVTSGSQQQWFSRNADWGGWRGGVWNMVFVGDTEPPAGQWPKQPYTVAGRTPSVREKPYLTVDADGAYAVRVPPVRPDSSGRSWAGGGDKSRAVPIDQFLVARADRDTAATINAALAAGRDLLLTPGVYHLDEPIHVTRADTVVLGLGYPTLIPDRGTAAVAVDDVDGVSVGGIICDAGPQQSPALIQVGATKGTVSHAADPVVLSDIVCRAGGASAGRAASFVTINADDVIGDNLWLWRADHGEGAGWTTNPVANGLVVNGDDVTCYGLFVEHCQGYQTLWNGERGRTYFYQSELPYDVPSQAAWSPAPSPGGGTQGFASYKVADTVKQHEAWGLGVYSNFTAAPVVLSSAVEVPDVAGVAVHHVVTIRLSGVAGSGIAHQVNGRGDAVIDKFEVQGE